MRALRKHPIHAVIFDADGTLVDSEVPGMDVVHEIAAAEGLVLTREQAHRQFRGVRMAEVVRWIVQQLPEPSSAREALLLKRIRLATTARFARGLQAMPGAPGLLQALRIPFCVATNGPREKVEQTLQLTGLRRYLGDRVFCAYEVGSFKPKPGLFLHAAHELGVQPAFCAVVEDSRAGIEAGLAAGMQVYTLFPPEELEPELRARVTCIAQLDELRTLWAPRMGIFR